MTWYSQAGQDEWVHSIIGDSGFFVDVGAYDGVEHSNTYALEQLGWEGICIEANHRAYEALARNRRCEVWQGAASNASTLVPFDGVQVGAGRLVDAEPLSVILHTINAPPTIDYLSVDVEGHELAVLAGMDFDRWPVKLVTIEHNLYRDGPVHKLAIYAAMSQLGFVRAVEDVIAPSYGPYEDWYVNACMF